MERNTERGGQMAITGDYSIPLFRFDFEGAQIGMYRGYGDAPLHCQIPGLTQSDQRTSTPVTS